MKTKCTERRSDFLFNISTDQRVVVFIVNPHTHTHNSGWLQYGFMKTHTGEMSLTLPIHSFVCTYSLRKRNFIQTYTKATKKQKTTHTKKQKYADTMKRIVFVDLIDFNILQIQTEKIKANQDNRDTLTHISNSVAHFSECE